MTKILSRAAKDILEIYNLYFPKIKKTHTNDYNLTLNGTDDVLFDDGTDDVLFAKYEDIF